MSYDLQIWSIQPVSVTAALIAPDKWIHAGDVWTRQGGDWQIQVGATTPVLSEDVPIEIEKALPGIAFLTELTLSPITAAKGARTEMARLAGSLARAASGVVFDPQADTITTARGISRLKTLGASETASVIALSWWFTSAPLIHRDIAALVSALELILPEALPRRYGPFEPPQFSYETDGRKHFETLFREGCGSLGSLVWYPHPPVAHVSLSIPPRVGGSKMGFRCGRLTIEVDEDALTQPGWSVCIQRAWRRISLAIQPFYGDVRRLGGFSRRRGRYWIGRETEHHPVCGWWWAGIPVGAVRSMVLGNPYRNLWPRFVEKSEELAGLSFLSAPDWRSDEALEAPPPDIAQVAPEFGSPNRHRRYPTTWPFAPPLTEE